ncbi:MAG: hypothetical protein DRO11_05390 [Methanobacteriota archaeon]|nr:MAG: hypothetical protein DRO11_05390 [Euryarchaeota archaeon]
MARLIIELNKRDPSIRSGVNIVCNPHLVEWLRDYCKERGWGSAWLIEQKNRTR